jgi:hypothetical protein
LNYHRKQIHNWQKAVARTLFWKDHAKFDEHGNLIEGTEKYIVDPFKALLHHSQITKQVSNNASKRFRERLPWNSSLKSIGQQLPATSQLTSSTPRRRFGPAILFGLACGLAGVCVGLSIDYFNVPARVVHSYWDYKAKQSNAK